MAEMSGRFGLPWILPGQAQKEAAHNEALAVIDSVLQAAVQAIGTVTPPVAPVIGQCWIVGAAPGGAWSGHAHSLAAWTDGGWRYAAPTPGMRVWSIADALDARWYGSAWVLGEVRAAAVRIGGVQVVGPRRPAIAAPAGGTVVDAEARAAIAAVIAALAAHGLTAA